MTGWNDPNGCYMDKWQNEVYPTEKTVRTARYITSIDNGIDHAITALRCAIEQVDKDIPDDKVWDAWRTTYFLMITNALNILEDLARLEEDITDTVMWEKVNDPDWFAPREESGGVY